MILNIEKYRDEILEEIEHRKRITDENNIYYDFEIYYKALENVIRRYRKDATNVFSDIKWLFSEYEPPLLENGDNLKTGKWILVRDHSDEKWKNRQFAFYYNKHFYCFPPTNTICQCNTVCLELHEQARLPEGNEDNVEY